ncbi:MAG: OmpA family protein [Saprospiraceae bacterium]|nr:OmpA family protein [Saprospiraceae bacterium]
MKRIFLFASFWVLALFLGCNPLPFKKTTPATMLEIAESTYQNQDYYNSLDWYEQYYNETKDNETAYKVAELYNLLRDYKKAETWYSKYLKKKDDNHPDAAFQYGRVLKMNEKYDDAILALTEFKANTTDEKLKSLAMSEIEGAKLAKKLKKRDDLKVENAGKVINSPFSESSPILTSDNELYFSSIRSKEPIVVDTLRDDLDHYLKIYKTNQPQSGGTWSEPQPLGTEINRPGYHTGNIAFNGSGDMMYFTRSQLKGNMLGESKIYSSAKIASGWGPAEEVKGINGDYIAKQPTVGELYGKEVLFFSSNMQGGKGGFDIYYATKKSDGSYDFPVSIGGVVNTVADEETPYYRDGVLYFSSTGHPGIGGFDVFSSKWDGSSWSKPENAGLGVNSSCDDLYFSLNKDGYKGTVISNRIGTTSLKSKTCCDDVFNVEIEKIVVNLIVNTFAKQKPLSGVSIQLVDMDGNKMGVTQNKTNNSGNDFNFPLVLEKSYKVIACKDGFFCDTLDFNTVNFKKSATIDKKMNLRPIPPKEPEEEVIVINQPIRLNSIYYDFDDDKILPDAETDLAYLYDLLQKYPDMVIELSSHTDSRGNDEYNKKLSQRRADSAKKWLVNKGIVDNRIKAVGYGETQILNQCTNGVNCSDDEHRLNRRTEFKIIAGPTSIKIEKRQKKAAEPTGSSKKTGGGPKASFSAGGDSVIQQRELVKFDQKMVDFGKVKKGDKKEHVFYFTNISEEDVQIEIVTSCDCTTLDWTRRAIKPNEKGKISAIFDSSSKEIGEVIDIDIVFKNTNPKNGYPEVEKVQYSFELIK